MKKRDSKTLKLTIELVPQSAWGQSFYHILPKSAWNKLRKETYDRANHQCEICGQGGTVHAHEQWDFDTEQGIQWLLGLVCLCVDCHAIKHWGRTSMVASDTEKHRLSRHFCKVNDVVLEDFVQHILACVIAWKEKNKYEYQIAIAHEERGL